MRACVAFILKLSELRFTPLFLTALEWARARPEQCARPHAFFRLISSLAASLRSVFVPFFRHILPVAVAILEPAQQQGDMPVSKKARRMAAVAGTADTAEQWMLRTEVVRSLSLCFLHDSVGFTDEPCFNKLLPPLLYQMTLVPPPGVSDEAAAEAGAALVECLPQMAKAAVGQDMLWRLLNRGVLLTTRSPHIRSRRLGLAVVTALSERLAEEYLILLPETVPFLSELVEDMDESVSEAARRLLDTLATLSGENIGDLLRQ
jgi:U3 small nucleolar RNA-associated protein 10